METRVITTCFKAEKTLAKDTVPVDFDAVLFWKVLDPKKAALDVADYQSAIACASQTAVRDVIGKAMLSDMLEGRDKKVSALLQKIIDKRTEPRGHQCDFRGSERCLDSLSLGGGGFFTAEWLTFQITYPVRDLAGT
jgi:regulator of protease activity HflC (stomatin/prohibitin superfamily)